MSMQKLSAVHKPTTQAVSGAGMDRKVVRPRKAWKPWLVGTGSAALIGLALYMMPGFSGKTLSVNGERIALASVSRGTFEDFIPVRARVTPAKTLYLDAVEGGRVERILVEDGAMLEAGQMIVELSNASLQLSVLGNEARVSEQLNNIRSIELSLEQNRLQHKRDIVDIQYQIKLLQRKLQREAELLKTQAISQSQYDDTQDTLTWYQQRLALTKESQASDARMQEEQLAFLQDSGARLEHNLELSRQNLANMNVRAPVAGKLSGFNVEVGQSIGRGERLGQIDTPDDYKLTAQIDEFYLSRVAPGQIAQMDGYKLQISKIYPQVSNGQFEVDLTFIDEQPPAIRRGQTMQLKLTLGDASSALLVPNGAFYQDTGGNWIFVVSRNGEVAERRAVRMGRRNNQFIEVLDGLNEGEQVVISSYSQYRDIQQLHIQD